MLRTIPLSLCKSSSRKIVTSIIGKESINRSFTSCLIRCQQQDSMESDLLANIPTAPFNPEVSKVLMAPIDETDIEVLPEGSLFLPEIKVWFSLQVSFLHLNVIVQTSIDKSFWTWRMGIDPYWSIQGGWWKE